MAIITSYPTDTQTTDGDNFLTSSSDGVTRLTPASGINQYLGPGWTLSGDSWSYASYDATAKIGVINTAAGANTKYTTDMRIKFSQPTLGQKYGRVLSVSTSSITVQMLGGTVLANEAITATFYSTAYAPFGYTNSQPSLSDTISNFVVSGGVWSIASGLNGAMSAAFMYYNGAPVYAAAITSRAFTASRDTYVDIDNTGLVTYVAVTNGATTGMALTANSIRVAKVVTNASAITTISYLAIADPLGNIIYPTGPTSAAKIQNPYKFSAYKVSAQSIPAASAGKVAFELEDFDTSNSYDAVTNFRFVAPVAGFYMFNAGVSLTTAGNSDHIVSIYKNNVEALRGNRNGGSLTTPTITVSGLLKLSVGEYVEIFVYNGTGGGKSLETGQANVYFNGFLVSTS